MEMRKLKVLPKQRCWCCKKEVEDSEIAFPICLCLSCYAAFKIVIQKEKARLALNLKDPSTEKDTKTIIESYKKDKENELSNLGFAVCNKQEGPYIKKDVQEKE